MTKQNSQTEQAISSNGVLSDVCPNCEAKLEFREIETTQTKDMERQGHHNPSMFNHWGFGCPKSNNRECFDETYSTKEGAKRNYYERLERANIA